MQRLRDEGGLVEGGMRAALALGTDARGRIEPLTGPIA